MPSTDDLIIALQRHNHGRHPQLLARKYGKMAQDEFQFLRGADHLFYDALPDLPLFRSAPLAWCCGDLHVENFGSYKGDNRQVYFDISDFDEAALAPASWDIVRLLASIQCGADTLRATPAQALEVSHHCLAAYRKALADGKPLWVERETSAGLVNELLSGLRERERAGFLDKRTRSNGQLRSLRYDNDKALPASAEQRLAVTAFMAAFALGQPDPAFYAVRDVALRIAGTGSLGVMRFVVLVEGKGSPDRNYLLDIKQALPSALLPRLAAMGIKQPEWPDEALRVQAVQRRMQAVDHAFLHAVTLAGRPCTLKGLQASEDKVDIGKWGKKLERLAEVVGTMGCNLAWDQLRAAGRGGAAPADALIDFALRDDWVQPMMDAAAGMTALTRQQWEMCAPWLASQAKVA
jgi:uncharacterized protein (DUF2252 family)